MSVSEQLLTILIITLTINALHNFVLGVTAHPQGHAILSPLDWGLSCYIKGSLVAQLVKNLPAMQETRVPSLGWEDPLEKGKATHSSILAWRIPWTIIHGVTKSQT